MKKFKFAVFCVFTTTCVIAVTQNQALSEQRSDSEIKASSPRVLAISPYDKISMDVITPHVKWATPLKGGRIKTLVVSHVSQREVVELAQRLSIECRIMMMNKRESTYFTKSWLKEPDENVDAIFKERLAEEYDLIILATIDWSALPEYARTTIEAKVRAGAGLIYINPEKSDTVTGFLANRTTEGVEYVTTGVPLRHLPIVKGIKHEKLFGFAKMGEGRVMTISYPETDPEKVYIMTPTGSHHIKTKFHEYIFSLIAKSAVWAVKREPAQGVTEITALRDENGVTLRAEISSDKAIEGRLEFAVRDDMNNLYTNFTEACTLQAGKHEITKRFGLPKSGVHYFDIWLKEDGKVLDWGSAAVEIDAGNVITEITTDKAYYSGGELIKGKILFQESPASDTVCVLRLYDNFERVISQQTISTLTKEQPFAVGIRDARSLLMHLRAELRTADGRVICTGEKPVPVPDKTRGDFRFVMWSSDDTSLTRGYLGKHIMEAFSRHGADSYYARLTRAASLFEVMNAGVVVNSANQYFVPYMFGMASTSLPAPENPEKPVRPRCYTDPKYLKSLTYYIERNVEVCKTHGLSIYSLSINGDIGRDYDYCFSPTCQADFIVFLKEKYGDLATLNRHWRSDHQSWESVKPMPFSEADKLGNYAVWVDHRLHMERVFANVNTMLRNKIKEHDPDAYVGTDETSCVSCFSGIDWVQLSKIFDYTGSYMCPSRFEQREITRSLITNRPGFSGLWMGSYNQTEGYNRYVPWYALMKGGSSVWWWRGFSTPDGINRCALDSSLHPIEFFTFAAEEVKEIKRGIGKLLIDSLRDSDQVAVYYSPLSVHAAAIVDKLDLRKNSQYYIHLCFIHVLNELGLQYEFVTDEQIMEGKLESDGYKAMFLPSARSLSDPIIQKLHEFTKTGGLLVANGQPGMMDENCHLRKKIPLAGVFNNFTEPMKINNFEKGHSLWLDDVIDAYYPRKDTDANRSINARLRELLGSVGVESRVKVKKPDGSDIGESEIAFFKNGTIDYLFFMRDYNLMKNKQEINPWLYRYHGYSFPEDAQAPQAVTITLPESRHVYDIRSGVYIGETDTVNTTVLPAIAKVYALLPYKVTGMELSLDKAGYKCGESMKYNAGIITQGGNPAAHVFRVELTDPAGTTSEYLAENIIVREGGKYSGSREIALNEMRGTWRLRIKDVASGQSAEQEYVVQ